MKRAGLLHSSIVKILINFDRILCSFETFCFVKVHSYYIYITVLCKGDDIFIDFMNKKI